MRIDFVYKMWNNPEFIPAALNLQPEDLAELLKVGGVKLTDETSKLGYYQGRSNSVLGDSRIQQLLFIEKPLLFPTVAKGLARKGNRTNRRWLAVAGLMQHLTDQQWWIRVMRTEPLPAEVTQQGVAIEFELERLPEVEIQLTERIEDLVPSESWLAAGLDQYTIPVETIQGDLFEEDIVLFEPAVEELQEPAKAAVEAALDDFDLFFAQLFVEDAGLVLLSA